ncbi:Uu.00g042040.m01.CDS01 [Anthostomella pinea]|uniref:Uu.00g042040.m01.CDS01 n=1 Tax=Anthostomella pinea TaxID=933095 RepID=A0AAI8VAI5_9PEZI|nr:Uu.00g042040.m01.CDS01 [Anthostomella pinea]
MVWVHFSLYQALTSLRLSNKARVIWADAICINQENLKERQNQVGMMQRIYSMASTVIMQLGRDRGHAGPCFQTLSWIVAAWSSFQAARLGPSSSASSAPPGWYKFPGLSRAVPRKFMRSVSRLFAVTYWRRLWIVQEVVSARLATVVWGPEKISWTIVGLAAALIRNNEALWRAFIGSTPPSMRGRAKSGLMNAYLMHQLSQQDSQRRQLSFLDLLRLTSSFGFSVIHDRIYAILGLPSQHSGPGTQFLRPDYTLLKEGLNIQVCRQILHTHNKPFDLLSAVKHEHVPSSFFPTWIPQWQVAPIRSITGSYRESMKFNASAGAVDVSPPRISLAWPGRTFTVEGIMVDRIETSTQDWNQGGVSSNFWSRVARGLNRSL